VLPEAVQENLVKLLLVAGECIRQGHELPSLILVYSGIDAMGWLASPEQYATENTFTTWVDRWLLPASPLPCTSLSYTPPDVGSFIRLPLTRGSRTRAPSVVLFMRGAEPQSPIFKPGQTAESRAETWLSILMRFIMASMTE